MTLPVRLQFSSRQTISNNQFLRRLPFMIKLEHVTELKLLRLQFIGGW